MLQKLTDFANLFAPPASPQNDTGAVNLEEPAFNAQKDQQQMLMDQFVGTLNPFQKDFNKDKAKKDRKIIALKLLAGMLGGG